MKMKELHEDIIDCFIRYVANCLMKLKSKQSWGRKMVADFVYQPFASEFIKENTYHLKFFDEFRPFILKELSEKTVYNQKEMTIKFRDGAKKYISKFKGK